MLLRFPVHRGYLIPVAHSLLFVIGAGPRHDRVRRGGAPEETAALLKRSSLVRFDARRHRGKTAWAQVSRKASGPKVPDLAGELMCCQVN